MSTKNQTRVRFAPSPTGYLHIGSLRTALYNFLFARHNKGVFLIRIEDTDKKRQIKGATESLIATLKQFNIESDEPIITQSKRLEIYKKHAENLVKSGHAYYCLCTPSRLEKVRNQQESQKQPPKYDGHCRNNDLMPHASCLMPKPHVIRLKVPQEGTTKFKDIVRGEVEFDNKIIDDQVLLKSDGYPTYHLANIIDDHEMKISHVIRGEEWVSSTPKHIILYQAFGWAPPKFAHLPLLLNPDKSKLSKRQGDVAVEDYLKKGYLKDALINFIAFLGWNPGTNKEIYTTKELIKDFKLEKVQKAGAVFNVEKLDWLNSLYIRKLKPSELVSLCQPFSKNKLTDSVTKLAQDRLKKLSDIDELTSFIFQKELTYKPDLLIPKKSDKQKTIKALNLFHSNISKCQGDAVCDAEKIRNNLDDLREKNNLTRSEAFWPLRVSLAGQKNSPDVFDIISALGKEKTAKRIKTAINKLK
ncbi:glutamate--tRNA ligase [Candidatus Falkowbacteria bacterium]|nr:glutamate--tRNA ligase [Candidatus Falkowbacteria bacterium]